MKIGQGSLVSWRFFRHSFSLAAGQTRGTGSGWTFAAQTSGSGTVHPTTGDTFTVTFTTSTGVTQTVSGHF
jgi:hypothetical protein